MATKTKRIIGFVIMGIVLVALIVGNVLCGVNATLITRMLCGTGLTYDTSQVENAQALGDELCREIAEEGIVLLKNREDADGNAVLPLASDHSKKLNVFGWNSSDSGFLLRGIGSGSSTIREEATVTLQDALKQGGFQLNQQLVDLYDSLKKDQFNERTKIIQPDPSVYTDSLIESAKEFSDTALVVLSRIGGENMEMPMTQTKISTTGNSTDAERTYLQTSAEEDALLEMVGKNFDKVIVIVNTSNTMHLNALENDNIDAVLYVGLLGQSGAAAIPKILTGEVDPSGKTTDTYIYDPKNDPAYANYNWQTTTPHIQYLEDIYFGYKWYETADAEGYWKDVSNAYGKGYDGVVQYPFGHGLSYTDFEWEITDLSIPRGSNLTKDSKIEVTVAVTNTGEVKGKDVVQLYYTPPYTDGGIEKAYVNLVAFAKTTELEPGQRQENIKLSFSAYDMASYDAYDANKDSFRGYELEAGSYEIKLMKDAHTLSGCEGATIEYKVAETITFPNDPVTNAEVENRFTDKSAYGDLPIDGSTIGASQEYLTRADFKGSFPSQPSKPDNDINWFDQATSPAYYLNTSYDQDKMPVTGVEHDLRLVTKEDGSFATADELGGKTEAKLVYNEKLIRELAEDYNSSKWNDLLDQMSLADMFELVECAGFRTEDVASIGKPYMVDCDGPAGFNVQMQSVSNTDVWTAYPSETLIGCSWNTELMYNMGLSMGVEAKASGVSGWYAPGVNLHRSAYNGRNFEYYGEDAVLSGKLAAEVIRGAKANGLTCYLKHFVASEAGNNPQGVATWLTEQNLRENYLRPFEIAVKEGDANAMMTAFNRVGGIWAGGNYALCTEILRNEWGFRGMVVTDWTMGGPDMAPKQGIRAGNDAWLNPNGSIAESVKLDQSDPTNAYCVRLCSKNILYTMCDTYTYAKDHEGTKDDRYNVTLSVPTYKAPFAWWVVVLVVIDVTAVAAMGISTYFLLRKKKDKGQAEGKN